MSVYTFHNGNTIPTIGFGVWQAKDGAEVVESVQCAIETGYRLIDTASIYGNEAGVGEAIKHAGVARDELFITTKVWNSDQGYDETLRAFESSMSKLGLDSLDLYLIHWPIAMHGKYVDTYRALERLYDEGVVKNIGVANFHQHHLETLFAKCNVKPVLNQIELHPYLSQTPLRTFCQDNDIVVQPWSPLMHGGAVLVDEVIVGIAKAKQVTPAQVVLRWHLQHGLLPIPKSVTPSRIRENFDVFGFSLSDEEMTLIDSLNRDERFGPNPDEFDRI
ncbi:MAG: aldo/keto reductase [Bacilli bacterium]